jgi:hypothetical protein
MSEYRPAVPLPVYCCLLQSRCYIGGTLAYHFAVGFLLRRRTSQTISQMTRMGGARIGTSTKIIQINISMMAR